MVKQLAALFLKLGAFAFGGPAAHIAMMNDEVVEKRKWFTQSEFLDLMSFTNLIPGPNSTELAILIGYKQAGIKGLLIAGVAFITPALLIVILFTMFYMKYQSVPQLQNILSGMLPVMIVIIMTSAFKITKKTVSSRFDKIILVISVVLLFLNVNEFIILVLAGTLKLVQSQRNKLFVLEPFSLSLLFLSFLKIGAFLYGSGYVLVSFLQSTFVTQLGWLTDYELINLVLIGEITPGPLFTSATAIGYYLFGLSGALVSTLGIFTPSFILIAVLYPFYERLKHNTSVQSFLSGISIASLSMMFYVVITLILKLQNNLLLYCILILTLTLSIKYKVNNFILIIIGGFLGFMLF